MSHQGTEALRAYLREVDNSIAKPLQLGEAGRRLLDAATDRLVSLGAIRWESVGSTSCATSVAGYSDIDMLAVFLDPIRHGIDNSFLPYSMGELRDAISRGLPTPPVVDADNAFERVAGILGSVALTEDFEAPVPDPPAVHFESRTTEPSVEIVPGIEADILWDATGTAPSSGLVRVAFPTKPNRWLGTEPELHNGVIDQSCSGTDYSPRELIRLVKLLKYRRDVPVRSYFLEVFCLRWLEGSESFPAKSINEIVETCGTAWSRRQLGPLVEDVPELLAALAGYLRAVIAGLAVPMVDLTTPEQNGTVEACEDPRQARAAAAFTESIAHAARLAVSTNKTRSAIAGWQQLLGFEI